MYKQFVAWSCNGSRVAPLTDYMNNPIYQELISEDDYFDVLNDERIYLDLRVRSGCVKKAEKLSPHSTKRDSEEKVKTKGLRSFLGRIPLYFNEKWPNLKTQNRRNRSN